MGILQLDSMTCWLTVQWKALSLFFFFFFFFWGMQYGVYQPKHWVVHFSVTQADVLQQDSWEELHYSCCWLELVLHFGVDWGESGGSSVTCTVIKGDILVFRSCWADISQLTSAKHTYNIGVIFVFVNRHCPKKKIVQSLSWEMHYSEHRQIPPLKLLSSAPLKSRPSALALRAASIFQATHHKGFLFFQHLILFISICSPRKSSLQHAWEKCSCIYCQIQVVRHAWPHSGRHRKYLTGISCTVFSQGLLNRTLQSLGDKTDSAEV